MKNKVTMQQIADILKISKNSVSQALSGKDGVSEETRQLVMETAQQMGYFYTQGRVRKMQGRTGSIALIASEFAFSQKNFFGEIYLAIEQEASKRNLNLLIQSINQEAKERLILPPFIQNQQVDGILILSHLSTEYINAVISTGISTVLIDHHHPKIFADCILTNNRFGAYDAVQHLIDLGHRDIGYAGDVRFSPSYYERLEGYTLALEENGITVNPDYLLKDAKVDGEHIYRRLSAMKRQPSAWFCVNDALGFLFSSCLQQLGKKVPEDVAICNFDNGQLSRIANPAITTVDIDLKLYGVKAVEQLCWRMENQDEPFMEVLLPTTLIQRGSTNAVKTAN